VSIAVTNVVITNYRAKDTPFPSHDKDAFLYDPDAASPLCNPSFEVTIDNWTTEPMEIWVWMAATAWSDTRPVPELDPYVSIAVTTAGTYTLTWNGSNPGFPTWEGEWGTWSFDVDLYRMDPTGTWDIDHFYAKSHDGWSENYDVLIDPVYHSVWWHCDETLSPPGYQFRCNYTVRGDEGTPPTTVDLVTLKELTVKAIQTGPVTLNTLHDNIITYPGAGYTTEVDTVGTWRTVFTGQTASGAEHRRDGTNPRILAKNQARPRLVDLVFQGLPEETVTTQPNEVTPGGFIGVNDDDDDGELGVIDRDRAYNPATPVPLATDDPDLLPVNVTAPRHRAVDRYVELVVPSELNVWPDRKKNEFTGTAVPVARTGNHVATVIWKVPKLPAGTPEGLHMIAFYLEGMTSGTAQLTARLKVAADAAVPLESDTVNVTILKVELKDGATVVNADDYVYITDSPQMPQLKASLKPTGPSGNAKWRLYVEYTRPDRGSYTGDKEYYPGPGASAWKTVSAGGTWDIAAEFGTQFRGGKATIYCEYQGVQCQQTFHIRGDNPTEAAARAYLDANGPWFAYCIAKHESGTQSGRTYLQFNEDGTLGPDPADYQYCPNRGAGGAPYGWGMMQLDNIELPGQTTYRSPDNGDPWAQELWSRKANCDTAIQVLARKGEISTAHLNTIAPDGAGGHIMPPDITVSGVSFTGGGAHTPDQLETIKKYNGGDFWTGYDPLLGWSHVPLGGTPKDYTEKVLDEY
jgi:hypothetical protein